MNTSFTTALDGAGGLPIHYLHTVALCLVTLAALWAVYAVARRRTSTERGSV